eukprot:CAMPEP_0194340948 /NCGR_PEP_ID=MMETSP0171-20130528/88067_1 /TAXON_ID=218684 /ORGANISM="Corethron pennatum, Strain L29A3" /LENGTH=101 /DNA_ID=CAMNT_0039106093 /DNA_START=85 /DNA_END=390 /DNA_ORIENTATION=-
MTPCRHNDPKRMGSRRVQPTGRPVARTGSQKNGKNPKMGCHRKRRRFLLLGRKKSALSRVEVGAHETKVSCSVNLGMPPITQSALRRTSRDAPRDPAADGV